MITLKDITGNVPMTNIGGKWVPARPENGKRDYCPLLRRIKDAWAVFMCKAEAFTWPEDE